MEQAKENILVVSQDEKLKGEIHQTLATRGYEVVLQKEFPLLPDSSFALVITDVLSQTDDWVKVYSSIEQKNPFTEFIVILPDSLSNSSVLSSHPYLYNFITKPVNMDVLNMTIERALEHRRLRVENEDYQNRLEALLEETVRDLEDKNRLFNHILESIPLQVAFMDSSFKVLDANDRWLVDTQDKSYRGKFCFQIKNCGYNQRNPCPALQAFNSGRVIEEVRSNEARSEFHRFYWVPVKELGTPIGFLEIVEDISEEYREKRKREETLKSYKQLVEKLEVAKKEIEEINKQNKEQITVLTSMARFSDVLQATKKIDDIFHTILTVATASDGFGFNRGFLFTVEENSIKGVKAVGPSSWEEAGRLWSELANIPIEELFKKEPAEDKDPLSLKTQKISIPPEDFGVLQSALKQRRPVFVKGEDLPPVLTQQLSIDRAIVLPIIGKSEPIGLLIVDNYINQAPLSSEKAEHLLLFLNHAGLAIERGYYAEDLANRVEELKELNQALKESHARLVLAEKLSVVGEMTAKIAHEIRNPLMVIGGNASLLAETLQDKDEQAYNQAVGISKESSKLVGYLNDILDFSRFFKPRYTPIDFNNIIHNTLLFYTHDAESTGCRIKERLNKNIPIFFCDGGALKQIATNLIKNALDAMPEGGELTIITGIYNNNIYLVVKDTGKGVPNGYSKRIFEPFFTTRSTGTGLGLSISDQIAQAMGGKIWFKSKEGKGTAFFVRLPKRTKTGGG